MRNKKLLSTVVATAMIATMAMPVMAAGESGSVDVDVTTKNGVLRVQVPTKMAMEIDQFEITQTGAQIASEPFTMVNHSEMPVKVDITSTADLGTSVTLVATKKAAEDSTTEGQAWLAVAAQTADGSYDDLATDNGDSDASKPNTLVENYWDLADSNANVTTFDATSKEAKQSFYLAKAAEQDASSQPAEKVYTYAIPTEANKYKEAYAQFYALTEVTITDDGDDTNNATTEDKALNDVLAAGDVYVVAKGTGDAGASVPAVDGATMTKLAKGSTTTWAKTNEYYTAAATAVEASAVSAGDKYMYVAMNTEGGKAGFTYVGKLSDAGEKTWTSQNDIKGISIAYTIKGVTASSYEAVEDDCTYGLYKDPTTAIPESNGTTDVEFSYTGAKPTSLTIEPVTITGSNKASFSLPEGGGNLTITNDKITLTASYISMLKNAATRGTGTYKFTVNEKQYSFIIK